MEFSTIGYEDSTEEATVRLQHADILVVWGEESILGIITSTQLDKNGNCGQICELDILVDPTAEEIAKWRPKYSVYTDDGEPISVVHHQ